MSRVGDCAWLAPAPSSVISAHKQSTLPTSNLECRCRSAELPTVGSPSIAIVGRGNAVVLEIGAYTRSGAISAFLTVSAAL